MNSAVSSGKSASSKVMTSKAAPKKGTPPPKDAKDFRDSKGSSGRAKSGTTGANNKGGGGGGGDMDGEEWRRELAELSDLVGRISGVEGDSDADSVPAGPGALALLARLPAAFRELDVGAVAASQTGETVKEEDLGDAVEAAIERGCRVNNAILVAWTLAGGDGEGDEGIDGEGPPTLRERAKAKQVLGGLHYLRQALNATTIAWRTMASFDPDNPVSDSDLVAGIARFSTPDPEELNRLQQLYRYLLNEAENRGYRRSHGELYKRVVASGKGRDHDTHAWERACEMKDFVYDATRKEVNNDMWLNMTCMPRNVQAAVDHLVACHDVQLPELRRDRHVFSFADGVYMAAQDRFLAYGTPEHAALPKSVVAAKFFPLEFASAWDAAKAADALGADDLAWYKNIETPCLQKILDFQVTFSLPGAPHPAPPPSGRGLHGAPQGAKA